MSLFGPPDIEILKTKHDVKGLIKALKYKQKYRIRATAAIALGYLGDKSAVEPLIDALKDEDGDVRRHAIGALGEIGDTRALAPIITALNNGHDIGLQEAAAKALGKIGDARAVSSLITALKDGKENTRKNAAVSLGEIGDARAVEPLISALKDDSIHVQSAAKDALEKIGVPAVEALIRALKDRNKDVRYSAVTALGRIGDARAVEPIIATLKDSDIDVRNGAASALEEIGDARGVEPLVASLMKDTSWEVRMNSAGALEKIGWEPTDNIQRAFYITARRKWDEVAKLGIDAIGPLIAMLTGNDTYREHAVDELNKLGWEPADNAQRALYLVAQKKWDEAAKLGADAVGPLRAMLRYTESDNVQNAARKALKMINDRKRGSSPSAEQGKALPHKQSSLDGKVLTVDEAVDLLVSLYSDRPDGFIHGSEDEKPIIEIGEALNKTGGMKLMLVVHEEFAIRNRWCARNLESAWNGIGKWMG